MTEATIIKRVRAACVARDGYCRLLKLLGAGHCHGDSQWAHVGPWQRWRTVKQAPERRHCTPGSLMLCAFHHGLYDAKYVRSGNVPMPILIEALTDRYADGPLVFIVNGVRYEEAA